MATVRVARRTRFTTVDRRTVNDSALSFRARGVLLWLLDKPDGWRAVAEDISQAGGEGRDAIRTALKELEDRGYLVRKTERDRLGKWTTEHIVFERPGAVEAPEEVVDNSADSQQAVAGFPQRVTSAGFPTPDNQALITKTVNEDCSSDNAEPSASSEGQEPEHNPAAVAEARRLAHALLEGKVAPVIPIGRAAIGQDADSAPDDPPVHEKEIRQGLAGNVIREGSYEEEGT